MTDQLFFKGLLAALASQGTQFVDTRDDHHQVGIAHVITRLRKLQADRAPGASKMPAALIPGPVTGKYEAFDDALLSLQDLGYDSAQNPFYPGVAVTLSRHRADRILTRFTQQERDIFFQLASEFSGTGAYVPQPT